MEKPLEEQQNHHRISYSNRYDHDTEQIYTTSSLIPQPIFKYCRRETGAIKSSRLNRSESCRTLQNNGNIEYNALNNYSELENGFHSTQKKILRCSSVRGVRNNITSKMRIEMHHADHQQDFSHVGAEFHHPGVCGNNDQLCSYNKYTPKHTDSKYCTETSFNGDCMSHNVTKLQEMTALKKENEQLTSKNLQLENKIQEYVTKIADLQATLENKDRDMEHTLLLMYEKGMQIANRQREEELDYAFCENGKDGAINCTLIELLDKLSSTERSLCQWQTMRRQEIYSEGYQPETESEATLRFLRDSFYHYLTTRGTKQDDHLRAIVQIFNFTDLQKEAIAKSSFKSAKI